MKFSWLVFWVFLTQTLINDKYLAQSPRIDLSTAGLSLFQIGPSNDDEQHVGTPIAKMASSDSDIDIEFEGELSDDDLTVEDVSDESSSSHAYAVKIQERAAEFLTFIKQECVTTQVTVDSLVSGVDHLFQLYNKFLETRILSLSDSDFVKKEDIKELFAYLSEQTIFEGVQTKYRLEKFQQSRWDAVIPRKLVFTWKRTLLHGKVRQVPDKVAYYLDFLQQLESVLQCEDILYCVDHPKPPSEEFRSALDGYVYQNHPLVQKYPDTLAIVYYLDDIKAGDTLSSYTNLGLRNYLWTLANVYPELRSTVRAIQLQALSKASDAKFVKNGPILKNVIEGINKLSSDEGVTFTIRGVKRVFHGFLLFVVGDYPALANIGGFKESAAFAWRFCRQCMITQSEKNTKYEEREVTLRTEAMHRHQLEVMEGISVFEEDELEESVQHDKPTVKFGINSKSPLLQLKYFNITQALPQDIMHLFLEGIMETECRLVLDHAVSVKGLSLKDVNRFFKNFDFGKHDTDRPSPIESQHLKNGLRQTSAQILMMSAVLPFIVDKHCDAVYLESFLLLLKIMRLCFAHVLKVSHVTLLRRMIKKYLMQFNLLHPDKFTAKHHFLIHLPTQIVLFGILTEQWAMRFEAFHAILKRLTKILHNAKNLPFSLIVRMSSLQAYKIHLNQADFLIHSAIQAKIKKTLPLSEVHHQDKLITCLNIAETCEVDELSSLKWYGPVFSQGDTILISHSSANNRLPKFATVVQIFYIQKHYVVLFRELNTIAFKEDFNAYEVKCEPHAIFEAMDITKNCHLPQLMNLKHGDAHYVILRQDSDPHFDD